MKTLSVIGVLAILLFVKVTYCQNLIAVQNGSNVTFYSQVTAAVDAAISGDTVYIPSGSWSLGTNPLYLNKSLHIIGVGHNPAYTQAGGITYLIGSITIRSGASSGSLTGVVLTGGFGSNQMYPLDAIINYSLSRNKIGGQVALNQGFAWSEFAENIFDNSVSGNSAYNNHFYNNIFTGKVGDFSVGNMFKNNIWMNTSTSSTLTFSYCVFDNNIIFSIAKMGTPSNCIFNNNLFIDNVTFPYLTNTGSNNIVNQAQSTIFVNQTGSTFSYAHDYHLKSTCPGINAGKDGTDIGIYGGASPWKEGSIPYNPHFQSVNIAPATNSAGNLNVNIQVEAQPR